jgi:hypothetical protein
MFTVLLQSVSIESCSSFHIPHHRRIWPHPAAYSGRVRDDRRASETPLQIEFASSYSRPAALLFRDNMDNFVTPGDDDASDEDEVITVTRVDVAHMYRRVDELYTDRSYSAIGDVCDLIICIRFRLLRMKRELDGVDQNQGPVRGTAIDVNCPSSLRYRLAKHNAHFVRKSNAAAVRL